MLDSLYDLLFKQEYSWYQVSIRLRNECPSYVRYSPGDKYEERKQKCISYLSPCLDNIDSPCLMSWPAECVFRNPEFCMSSDLYLQICYRKLPIFQQHFTQLWKKICVANSVVLLALLKTKMVTICLVPTLQQVIAHIFTYPSLIWNLSFLSFSED